MNENVKRIFFAVTLLTLLVAISTVSASDVADDATPTDVVTDSVSASEVSTADNSIADNAPTKNIKKETTTDLYVSDTTGSDDNSGTNENPYKTIQKALDQTSSDSTYNIHIREGTYKGLGNTNLTVNGEYNINIIGTDNTIIDGEVNYTEHVTQDDDYFWGSSKIWEPYDNGTGNWAMNITTGNGLITITNLTIQNCWNPGGSSISLYNTSTIDNYGNLEVNNVSFIFNHGGTGGAIRNNANATIIIKDSLFEGNRKASTTGNYGAGIYNNGTATIINSTFQNNYARWGTVTNDNIMTIINSTLRDNIAYDGGSTFKTGSGLTGDTGESDFYASWNTDGIVTIVENCTFINNEQCDVYQGQGILSINNSVFNKSTGVYIRAGLENDSHIINNSVFEDMTPSNLFGDLSSSNAMTFAIYQNTERNVTITNCNISSKGNSTIKTRANTVIRNNNINGSLMTDYNNTIENNNIHSNDTSISIIDNNILSNNNITSTALGILVKGSKNSITNNNITSTQESIIVSPKNAKITI